MKIGRRLDGDQYSPKNHTNLNTQILHTLKTRQDECYSKDNNHVRLRKLSGNALSGNRYQQTSDLIKTSNNNTDLVPIEFSQKQSNVTKEMA
jgi:hypothetical protein